MTDKSPWEREVLNRLANDRGHLGWTAFSEELRDRGLDRSVDNIERAVAIAHEQHVQLLQLRE